MAKVKLTIKRKLVIMITQPTNKVRQFNSEKEFVFFKVLRAGQSPISAFMIAITTVIGWLDKLIK